MIERYIAFDVETPNRACDRMSAIGVTVIEDGRIVREFYSLVDPQTHFDAFNMQLTGITPLSVAGQPAFPELWRELEPLFTGGVLVAHNAPFDMRVLALCLRDYGVAWRRQADYACTCRMARAFLPHLPDHKLSTMCRHFAIELDHHRADSDSRACAQLLLHYRQAGCDVGRFVRRYDLAQMRTLRR